MATMTTSGLEEYSLSLDELAAMPESVMDDMLQAQADIVETAQQRKGKAYGVHRTGVTLGSIKRGNPKKRGDGRSLYITPQGVNADGNRNAEVAFINEFGKHGQPARPFIRDANEESADSAAEAAADVHERWMRSKGL